MVLAHARQLQGCSGWLLYNFEVAKIFLIVSRVFLGCFWGILDIIWLCSLCFSLENLYGVGRVFLIVARLLLECFGRFSTNCMI